MRPARSTLGGGLCESRSLERDREPGPGWSARRPVGPEAPAVDRAASRGPDARHTKRRAVPCFSDPERGPLIEQPRAAGMGIAHRLLARHVVQSDKPRLENHNKKGKKRREERRLGLRGRITPCR